MEIEYTSSNRLCPNAAYELRLEIVSMVNRFCRLDFRCNGISGCLFHKSTDKSPFHATENHEIGSIRCGICVKRHKNYELLKEIRSLHAHKQTYPKVLPLHFQCGSVEICCNYRANAINIIEN